MKWSCAHLHSLTTQSPGHSAMGTPCWVAGEQVQGDVTPRRAPGSPCPHPAVQKSWCSRVGKPGGDETADRQGDPVWGLYTKLSVQISISSAKPRAL